MFPTDFESVTKIYFVSDGVTSKQLVTSNNRFNRKYAKINEVIYHLRNYFFTLDPKQYLFMTEALLQYSVTRRTY